MNQYQKLYESNFNTLMKEAQKCSCWTHRGNGRNKCSNPKHQMAVSEERRLSSLCNKHQELK